MKKQFLLGLLAMTLPLSTWADGMKIQFADAVIKDGTATFEYAGTKTLDNVKNAITVVDEETEELLALGRDYKLLFEQTPDNVGSYEVKAVGIGDDNLGETKTAGYSIVKKTVTTLTFIDNKVTKVYGTDDDEIDLTKFISTTQLADNTEEELENFVKGLQMSRKEGAGLEKAGATGITVNVSAKDGDTGSNYLYEPVNGDMNVPMIIEKAPLTITLSPRMFNNQAVTDAELSRRVTDNKYKVDGLVQNDNVTVTFTIPEGSEVKNANAEGYDINVALTGDDAENYSYPGTVKLVINKAKLTVAIAGSDEKIKKTYGEEDPNWYEKFTFNVSYSSTALTEEEAKDFVEIFRANDSEDVLYVEDEEEGTTTIGGYAITIQVNDNFELVGYDTPEQLVIEPKSIVAAETDIKVKVAEDSEKKEMLVYKGKDFTDEENYNELVKDLCKLTYELGEDDVKYLTTDDYDVLVYNHVSSSAGAINAGDQFIVKFSGKKNYTGDRWSPAFTITKAEIKSITKKEDADPKAFMKVADGEGSGDLSKYFDFDGLVGKDVDEEGNIIPEEVKIEMSTKQTEEGKYMVHIWNTDDGSLVTKNPRGELKNYTITAYTDPKFTILFDGVVLYGDNYESLTEGEEGEETADATEVVTNTEILEKYAGMEVTSVEINNLRSLTPATAETNSGFQAGRYYSLVLPFEVTPKEISQCFEYAVVNVPNTANTNPDMIAFKLTLDPIPANTMMLIRIIPDEKIESDGFKLEFANKTIAENLEPNPNYAEDGGGHHFCITYEERPLKAGEAYWNPRTAGEIGYTKTEGFIINAFNGYFTFDNMNEEQASGVRVIFEEADGSTTAINTITGETNNYSAEGWYAIDGKKLNAQPTQKGVYINNGKKVVIK